LFRSVYLYGHLLTIAFSLLMALAFVLMARRLGGRRDLWNAVIFFGTACGGAIEMAQAGRPTVLGAELLIAFYAGIYLLVTVGFHDQFADEVLPASRRALYRRGVALYAGFCVVLVIALFAGLVDRGTHALEVWGATSMVVAVPLPVVAVMALVPLGNVALCGEMLLRDGPRRRERAVVAVPMLVAPLIGVWELSLSAGLWLDRLPVGGYFAAFLGIQGMYILIARLEQADDRSREHDSFAGYRLDRRLGAGGMAEVFLAHKAGPDPIGVQKQVAVKRLHADFALDPRFVQMFVEEARLVARLRHANIVALHDVGLEDGQLYLAMELVDGASLARIARLSEVDGRGLPAAVVAEIGIQVADALAHAHGLRDEAGKPLDIVHRDVSPQNILVDRTGMVKLADFGIARTSERMSQTATGVLKGKLPYVAPEQIRAEPYDHRVDLYALGVVLFELATGRPPFVAPSDAALIFQIVEGRPAFHLLDGVAAPLAEAIKGALTASADERIDSATALRGRLVALRDELAARRELGRLAEQAGLRSATGGQASTSVATILELPATRRG
jgi:tRNA A-37 threonylcarbamoyl transferase component Bud32